MKNEMNARPYLGSGVWLWWRAAGGNADLSLPSQWGSRPAERSHWWHEPEMRYPNSGYYSSEGR